MKDDLTVLLNNARIHPLGVKIDAAVEVVLA